MTEFISSTANPKIKQIRKLADRKERSASGLYFVEGLRIVIEALQQWAEIEHLIIAPDLIRSDTGEKWIQSFERDFPGKVIHVTADVFRSLSQKDGPQGLAAVLRQRWADLADITEQPGDCWVALDEVADPGNLGTILRTCDATGVKGVILLDSCTDPYDPTALRGSMGAIFSVQLVKATLDQFESWVNARRIPVIGASDKAKQNYHSMSYPNPMVLLMGSERQGLDQRHLDMCTEVVSIPMRGRSNSLNLAVATGILLYEMDHQFRTGQESEGKST